MIDEAGDVEDKPFFMYFANTLTHAPDVYDALTLFNSTQSPRVWGVAGRNIQNLGAMHMVHRHHINHITHRVETCPLTQSDVAP